MKTFLFSKKFCFGLIVLLCSLVVMTLSIDAEQFELNPGLKRDAAKVKEFVKEKKDELTEKIEEETGEIPKSKISHGLTIMKKFIEENFDFLKEKKNELIEAMGETLNHLGDKWEEAKEYFHSNETNETNETEQEKPVQEDQSVNKNYRRSNAMIPEKEETTPIDESVDAQRGAVQDILSNLKEKYEAGKETLLEGAHKISDKIKDAIPDSVSDKIHAGTEYLSQKQKQVSSKINEGVTNIGEKVKGYIPDSVSDSMDSMADSISEGYETVKGKIKDAMPDSASVDSLKSKLSEGYETAKEKVKDVLPDSLDSVTNKLSEGFTTVKDKVKDAIPDSVGEKLQAGKEYLGHKTDEITSKLSESASSMGETIKHIPEKVSEGVSNLGEKIKSNIPDSVPDSITEGVHKIEEKLQAGKEYLAKKKDDLTEGITNLFGKKNSDSGEAEEVANETANKIQDINDNDKSGDYLNKVAEGRDFVKSTKDELLENLTDKVKEEKDELLNKLKKGKEYLKEKKDELLGEGEEAEDKDKFLPKEEESGEQSGEGSEGNDNLVERAKEYYKSQKGKITEKLQEGKEFVKGKLGYSNEEEEREEKGEEDDEGLLNQAKDYINEKTGNLLQDKYQKGKEYIKEKKDKLVDKAQDLLGDKGEVLGNLGQKLEAGKEYIKRKKDQIVDKFSNQEGEESSEEASGEEDVSLLDRAKNLVEDKKDALKERLQQGKEFVMKKKDQLLGAANRSEDEDEEDSEDLSGEEDESLIDKAKDLLQGKQGTLKEKVEQGKEFIKRKKDQIVDKAEELWENKGEAMDNLSEKIEQGKDFINKKKGDFIDSIQDFSKDNLGQKVKGKIEEGKEYLKNKKDEALEYFSDLTNAEDSGEEGTFYDKVKDTLEEKKDDLLQKVEQGKDFVRDWWEDKSGLAENASEPAKEEKEPLVTEIQEGNESVSEPVKGENLSAKQVEGLDYALGKRDDILGSLVEGLRGHVTHSPQVTHVEKEEQSGEDQSGFSEDKSESSDLSQEKDYRSEEKEEFLEDLLFSSEKKHMAEQGMDIAPDQRSAFLKGLKGKKEECKKDRCPTKKEESSPIKEKLEEGKEFIMEKKEELVDAISEGKEKIEQQWKAAKDSVLDSSLGETISKGASSFSRKWDKALDALLKRNKAEDFDERKPPKEELLDQLLHANDSGDSLDGMSAWDEFEAINQ